MSVWRFIWLVGIGLGLLVVQGCREEEQDRVLLHEKGVYQGERDDGLSADQLDDLRERARIQSY